MTLGSGKVRTQLECRRCHSSVGMCVPVRRGAPAWALCDLPGHAPARRDAGGDLVCEQCGRHWGLNGEDITRIVEDLLGRDLAASRALGAVLVVCPPR